MGQRDIRRLLITGAMAVIRWATRRSSPKGSWLARLLEREPLSVVAVALANKMARGIWACGRARRAPRTGHRRFHRPCAADAGGRA